jgi:hypothetical protein
MFLALMTPDDGNVTINCTEIASLEEAWGEADKNGSQPEIGTLITFKNGQKITVSDCIHDLDDAIGAQYLEKVLGRDTLRHQQFMASLKR